MLVFVSNLNFSETLKTLLDQEKQIEQIEQRNESFEKELPRLIREGTGTRKGLQHSLPYASTISTQDDAVSAATELPEDDFGYGCVRSVMSGTPTSTRSRLENIG